MSRNAVFEKHADIGSLVDLVSLLNEESDRGAVLVSAALIDNQLKELIQGVLIEKAGETLLNGFNSPLGTFSARTKAAYALGIISREEASECDQIRDIRNRFAHTLKVSDADWRSIKDRCLALKFSLHSKDEVRDDPIASFKSSAIAMVIRFINRRSFVSANRIKEAFWADHPSSE